MVYFDSVDELEYFDYVDFIDNYVSTFEVDKRTIHFSEFIKQQGRNKIVKPILFNEAFFDSQHKEDSNQLDKNGQNIEKGFLKITKTDDNDEKLREIVKNDSTLLNKNQQKINELEIIPTKINETELNESTKIKEIECKMIYPLEGFNKLSKNNQNLVEEASKDAEKQFLVGRFLIEGKNYFPKNISLGLEYIEQSIKQKYVNAIVYYSKLLIRGKIIQKDENRAMYLISILNTTNDSRKYLLQGLMSSKKNSYSESVRFFEEGIKLDDSECMYHYGKMLFLGEGVKKNNKESFKYFKDSKERGYEKSANFLTIFEELNKFKFFSELPSETQMILIKNNMKQQKRQELQFNQIILHPKNTETVYFNKSLKLINFHECLKQYKDITIEIGYPSDTFNSIIDLVIKIRAKNIQQLKIGIVFTSLASPLSKKCFSKDISYHQIESSIQTIPNEAFKNCTSMTKIIIPSSVTKIGDNVFYGIKALDLSGNIQKIYSKMFYFCSSLKQIEISAPVKEIEFSAFSHCSSLTQFTIPSSVTQIGKSSFAMCSSLIQITIPSSVTSIGDSVFSDCLSLKQITIPSSVTQIGKNAFCNCSSLKQITIPSSVTYIGENAFKLCSSLKKVTIPSSMTKIESSTFIGCHSLKEIIIISSVTQIGYLAFGGCFSLIQIAIPYLTQIEGGAFNVCQKLSHVIIQSNCEPKYALYERKFLLYKSSGTFDTLVSFISNAEKITLPTFIKNIEDHAFQGCENLKEITIPSSVTKIGEHAFSYCSSLKRITIPSSITQIEKSSFSFCLSLKQITIPSSVTSIGNSAFEGCSSLKEITIPSSVTHIGNSAFWICSSLKQITIPSSVTHIGNSVFSECSSLKEITIPSSVTHIGNSVFSYCSSLK